MEVPVTGGVIFISNIFHSNWNWLRGARIRRFITKFTRPRNRFLSWSSWIHSTPLPNNLPQIHSNPILPSRPKSSKLSLSFGLSYQNPAHVSPLSHACHMPCPPHSPWFDQPIDIFWWLQIMKFPIVQLSPFSRCFILLRSKYFTRVSTNMTQNQN
jgi:hypothetical protein